MAPAFSFIWRALVGVAVAYLVWTPLAEPVLVLVARGVLFSLSWLLSPPLITALGVEGETVDVRGILFEPLQWMGRWDAGNLPLFIVVGLGIAAVVPGRDLPARLTWVGMTLLLGFLVMVGVAMVEVLVVAVSWVRAGPGLALVDGTERSLLEEARQGINLVQLLFPASIGILAYVSRVVGGATGNHRTPYWWPVLSWALLLGVVFAMTRPVPIASPQARLARLERTASLNPQSSAAWLAVGEAALRIPAAPGALVAYRNALRTGADAHAARIGIAQSLLEQGSPREALAAAGAALSAGPASPILFVVEAEALLALGDPCDGLGRVTRALEARRGRLPAPELKRVQRRLRGPCRRARAG